MFNHHYHLLSPYLERINSVTGNSDGKRNPDEVPDGAREVGGIQLSGGPGPDIGERPHWVTLVLLLGLDGVVGGRAVVVRQVLDHEGHWLDDGGGPQLQNQLDTDHRVVRGLLVRSDSDLHVDHVLRTVSRHLLMDDLSIVRGVPVEL